MNAFVRSAMPLALATLAMACGGGGAPPPECTVTLSSATASVGAGAAAGSLGVVAPAGCAWTAAADVPWITVTSGAGDGHGSVEYEVAENPSTASRSGAVLVAGQVHTVLQAGAEPCTYALAPEAASFGAEASSSALGVVTGDGCPWAAVSNAPWIVVTSGASGTGPGLVGFAVEENAGDSARSGTVAVAGRTFTVLQGWGTEVIVIVQ